MTTAVELRGLLRDAQTDFRKLNRTSGLTRSDKTRLKSMSFRRKTSAFSVPRSYSRANILRSGRRNAKIASGTTGHVQPRRCSSQAAKKYPNRSGSASPATRTSLSGLVAGQPGHGYQEYCE